MAKNNPNRPPNQSFQQGCARLRYTTDTGFKVVHVGGKNAADKSVITAADVNNFAAGTGTIVNAVVAKHNPTAHANFGQHGLTQPALRGLSKEHRLAQGAASRSLREQPSHEDASISSTSDARALATTNSKKAKT
jgi:hypothetical protein